MAAGRTYWWAKDAAWIDRDAIVELGETHGPAGPLVLDVLSGMAKLENHAGNVFTGYRALARKCFITAELAEQIVHHAAQIGAIDDLDVDADGRRFRCRVSGWQADQRKGRAADRDAVRRERGAEADDVTEHDAETHASSRTLTHPHVPVGTGQDRTEQNTSSLRSEEPQPPMSNAARSTTTTIDRSVVAELFDHWRTVCQHPQAKPTAERLRAIRARLADGYTPGQIRQAIDGAARAPFVDQRGKRHDDLTLICRNGSKLEDFMDRANRPAPAATGPPSGRRDSTGYLDQLKRLHADATANPAEQSGTAAPPADTPPTADLTERTAA